MNRRNFFNTLGRYSILSFLLAILGVALHRYSNGVEDCTQESLCGKCSSLDKCELDKAKKFKRNS